MCVLITSTPPFLLPTTTTFPLQLHVVFLLKLPENTQCCLCALSVGPSVGPGWPPGAHIPEENWLFLLQYPSVANSFSDGVGLHMPFSHPCWEFGGLSMLHILCVQSQSLGVHVCRDLLMAGQILPHGGCPLPVDFTFFLPPLHLGSWAWGKGVWYRCPIGNWTLCSPYEPTHLLAMGICIDCNYCRKKLLGWELINSLICGY